MPSWARYLTVGVLVLGIAVGLWLLAPAMAPIKDGNALEFWMCSTRVDLGLPNQDTMGSTYPPIDGWDIYYIQHLHGQFVYKVSRTDVAARFPEVVAKLETAQETGKLSPWRSAAFVGWKQLGPESAGDFDLLLAHIRTAWLDSRDEKGRQYELTEEARFQERWTLSKRYWLNGLLEFMYLSLVIVFAAWPWLRRKGVLAWSIHLGLFPLLLFLPYFLGYAMWTFTSVGPSGGILYPWAIRVSPNLPIWTSLDVAFFQHVPQILAPLAQDTGGAIVISGGAVGPVRVIIDGLLLAGLAVAGHYVWRSRYRWFILLSVLAVVCVLLLPI